MGTLVGFFEALVGSAVGRTDTGGEFGFNVGSRDGSGVGIWDGLGVGFDVGGVTVGKSVGYGYVGFDVGEAYEGFEDGCADEGNRVGKDEGLVVGTGEGNSEGRPVGWKTPGVGLNVGSNDGVADGE